MTCFNGGALGRDKQKLKVVTFPVLFNSTVRDHFSIIGREDIRFYSQRTPVSGFCCSYRAYIMATTHLKVRYSQRTLHRLEGHSSKNGGMSVPMNGQLRTLISRYSMEYPTYERWRPQSHKRVLPPR